MQSKNASGIAVPLHGLPPLPNELQHPGSVSAENGQRRVLCYDRAKMDSDITDQLVAADWKVDTAGQLDTARFLLHSGHFNVGLFTWHGGECEQTRKEIDELISASPVTLWIALVSPEVIAESATLRLVSTYFFDFHTLPADHERLLTTLGHADGMVALRMLLRKESASFQGSQSIIGQSAPIKQLLRSVDKVAVAEAPVLISGESGTGKELAANAIHRHSARARGPFVVVNCGALPATLIHAELFGHEKGAFTGATHRRIGRFEAAHKGTLFLDEIADLPLDLQVNLLRVLEQKKIERVGSTESIPIDVRVIAASHKDLDRAVAEERFREDLYFRLDVLQLRMPNLRDRDGDIELLGRFFMDRFVQGTGGEAKDFSQEALLVMHRYGWPGNVRELMNRVQRAVVMSDRRTITPQDLGLDRRVVETRNLTLSEARDQAEKQAVVRALKRTCNNVSEAARELDVSRATLYRIMNKHGLDI